MVDILLQAGALVARSQSAARSAREETGFDALGLRVVSDVLHDDAPFSVDVLGAHWSCVQHLRWADVALGTNPVGFFESVAGVAGVIELALLDSRDSINQVISRLVSYFSVFLQYQWVVIDGVLDNKLIKTK